MGGQMANRPTIKDVAREAGVSPTTVDRALNGRSVVREETMRKIADAAHKIGYHSKGILLSRLDKPLPELRSLVPAYIWPDRLVRVQRTLCKQTAARLCLHPFTRLVHMLSAPVRYIWRPGYQIVRSKKALS